MSVNTHLTYTAGKLRITDAERNIIDKHVSVLSSRLASYFNANFISGTIQDAFPFGSYTRRTLMPRKADYKSDVDYMVCFKNYGYTPSTYLKYLRDFAEAKYTTSEIYTSRPTIVLELSRIKIELVPAIKDAWDSYQIPAPSTDYSQWLYTKPNEFNTKVTNKNTAEKSLIRPLIRLLKYWNSQNGYVYSSYALENLIVSDYYFLCNNLRDYLYSFVGSLSTNGFPTYKIEKINRLKDICKKAEEYERNGFPVTAEIEIAKAIPSYE